MTAFRHDYCHGKRISTCSFSQFIAVFGRFTTKNSPHFLKSFRVSVFYTERKKPREYNETSVCEEISGYRGFYFVPGIPPFLPLWPCYCREQNHRSADSWGGVCANPGPRDCHRPQAVSRSRGLPIFGFPVGPAEAQSDDLSLYYEDSSQILVCSPRQFIPTIQTESTGKASGYGCPACALN